MYLILCASRYLKPTSFIYLAFEETDPFIYLLIQNVDLFIYCPSIFCTHLLLVYRQISKSIHWIPKEQAASKNLWAKNMCIYQDVRKMGPFTQESRKIGLFIYLLLKKRGQSYTWQRWKRGPFGTHIRTMLYIVSYHPPRHPPRDMVGCADNALFELGLHCCSAIRKHAYSNI